MNLRFLNQNIGEEDSELFKEGVILGIQAVIGTIDEELNYFKNLKKEETKSLRFYIGYLQKFRIKIQDSLNEKVLNI